ncbi:cellulose binding domain-containing protein [Phytomonospora endophytica]|uniref:CBM2 domain-containing protein n=1 Tax=Phytomonospora endophytica TaxID=714109 RepID=A0A841FE99_9ACTN|nr:cellulose binding domain-containing protein [Phytomonospora endophytica]MBB6034154.1 hypothetical protein [Phytomonospora endophytica]GIG66546.1 hypothetical protein Pen01_28410 [Phytomonospora endophytica]
MQQQLRPRLRLTVVSAAAVTAAVTAGAIVIAISASPDPAASPGAAAGGLDLSAANRRAPVDGLYDWSKAGYRGDGVLPGPQQVNPDQACRIDAAELAADYDVRPGDGADDTAGIQAAIDAIRDTCSASASHDRLSLITLPAGNLDVSRQLGVDADYTIIRGAGSAPGSGTLITYRPDANTVYDALTEDGSDWDEDGMTWGQGTGGWLWPGRGLFRVQSRAVHSSYASDHAGAPANRKDLFEGTVNVHWKSGSKLRDKPGDTGFAARTGDTVVHLASNADMGGFRPGGLVNVRGANSLEFYERMKATPTEHALQNIHMRQQIFTIAAVDTSARTITVDKPLEFDLPVTSTSDGSAPIDGKVYDSKAAPLVDPVVGVGIEDLAFTQAIDGLDPAGAAHNYGNMAPAREMHGIVFKWAADSWVRGVRAEMTGSHPIVTEEAYRLQIVGNTLNGSWNKGKGGNGYLRGSRVWDSIYAGNTTRGLRHFTFQWSASGNVVIGNDFDSDLNLHGGWERHNLFELNTVTVPYDHRSGSCTVNCGEEGGGGTDDSTWFPIWWGAGRKAVKWSGASGPRNVFHNNAMTKQTAPNGAWIAYYDDEQRVYQFGWDGSAWRHLDAGGTPIPDWAGRERGDYTGGHGVHAELTDAAPSLFLRSTDTGPSPTGPPGPTGTTSASPSSTPPSSSPTPTPDPSACLTATFTRTKTWTGGYSGDVSVTNGCAAVVPKWTVVFALPAGTTVSKAWNATHTANGTLQTFVNVASNGNLKPGATKTFGFNAKGTGPPSGCTVNGKPCGG